MGVVMVAVNPSCQAMKQNWLLQNQHNCTPLNQYLLEPNLSKESFKVIKAVDCGPHVIDKGCFVLDLVHVHCQLVSNDIEHVLDHLIDSAVQCTQCILMFSIENDL